MENAQGRLFGLFCRVGDLILGRAAAESEAGCITAIVVGMIVLWTDPTPTPTFTGARISVRPRC